MDTVDLAVFDRSIEVNLRSAVLGLRVGIPAMCRAGGGAIVITSWNTGLNGEANRFRYATAKAGVLNLMRSVAIDVAADNIRVNAVCPGPTLSGMTKHLVGVAAGAVRVVAANRAPATLDTPRAGR